MPQFGGKNAKKKSSSSTTKRHFTVVIGSNEHGLYVSQSPSSAARKAVSKLCAEDKKRKVQFSIREITQGSKKKTYGPYLGYIEKLKEPIELKGRVIKYKPVAKLSGKTGAKKGGMRGGARIYECYTKIPGTDYTFRIKKLGTDRNGKTIPFNIFYCLIIINNSNSEINNSNSETNNSNSEINNSNSETIVLDYDNFLAHLTDYTQDEFIKYLNEQSGKDNKNLSINFHTRIYFSPERYDFIRDFLKKCYDIPDSNKGKLNVSLQRYENSNKTFMIKDNVKLIRYNKGLKINLPNPRNVDIDMWTDRIDEWFLKHNSS